MSTGNPHEPREEYFDNEPTDVEVEDTGEDTGEPKPWDPNKIRISTKPFSLRQVVDMISDEDIDLAPDFQRLFVWKSIQRSRLIESILLGIPLPAFYFNQDHQGAMQVVDGVQRLTTIHRFVTGVETLSDLEYLKDLNGKSFKMLELVHKRRFQQTQIFVNVIEPQTPDDVKFDVFRRINTGGSPLTNQEIRHCMSRERSRSFLKRLIGISSFAKATDGAFERERRMADREVALRFCAFRCLDDLDAYREHASLDAFLLDFTRRMDGVHPTKRNLDDTDLERLAKDFDRAMSGAIKVFGKAAFRKYPVGAKRRGPINRALFESWAIALADYEPRVLEPCAEAVLGAARKAMLDSRYVRSISVGTGGHSEVKHRFAEARRILKDVAQ